MISAFKKNQSQASARVVDGKLILSFPHATTPIVWQMDLSQVKASALEVLPNKESGLDTLSLKTPKGEKLAVAEFETREDAIDGLMAASRALENGQGRIAAHTTSANQSKALTTTHTNHANENKAGRWIAGILGVLLLVVLFGVWGSIAPQTPTSFQTGSVSPTARTQTNAASAATSAGVPVSADDFLNGL